MSGYADLELGIHRRDGGRYAVELRYAQPDSDADLRLEAKPSAVEIDLEALAQHRDDPLAYGQWLSERCLFADPELKAAFVQAFNGAQSQGAALRVRLFIGADVPELHDLRWETLQNPATEGPLSTTQRVLFSRYLSSTDWRPVRLGRKRDLVALVVASNPSNLGEYGLAPVDVPGELARAHHALGEIRMSPLGDRERATLNRISARLRKGCDILYLVCHGALKDGEPWLWLEDDAGKVSRASGKELVTRIQEFPECPRLVILASCQSGGTGRETSSDTTGALAALGPRLAESGVPAVLAMQGDISMGTIERFMPEFFASLQDPRHSGEVDRALAVARASVRERPDWWVPVLSMRLRSGRIWYVPGFAGERGEFEQWQSICRFVRLGQVVPIVGPDIAPHIYGETGDLAYELAVGNGFPLSEYERTDLAKVTQYISTKSSAPDARNQVRLALLSRLRRKAVELPGDVNADATPRQLLEQIVPAVMKDADDPLRILAELGARIYVCATSDPLLECALGQAAGKNPVPLVSHWRDEREDEAPFYPDSTPDRPYIHYIFGDLRDEPTWVLTEDDFFDYLIRTSLYHDLIPPIISKALTGNCLLFLGFRLDDWRFRILFRMILAKGGSAQLRRYNHVGVQLNPDEHSLTDVERAKEYLERYFVETRIDIYWGSATDFLQSLGKELAEFSSKIPDDPIAADAGQW